MLSGQAPSSHNPHTWHSREKILSHLGILSALGGLSLGLEHRNGKSAAHRRLAAGRTVCPLVTDQVLSHHPHQILIGVCSAFQLVKGMSSRP
jgi:hypothetical protein